MAEALMKRILVTGASGFLGWNLYTQRPEGVAWYGTYHRHKMQLPDAECRAIDLTQFSEVEKCLADIQADAMIHTAAISDTHWCETHPEASEAINVEAVGALAKFAAGQSIPFVFVSSDLVFDGTQAPYAPDDTARPLSRYGWQKLAAEQVVREQYPAGTIVRVPLLFGEDGSHSSNHLSSLLRQWEGRHPIHLFSDEYRTPADGASVAEGIYMALNHPGQTLHLGGPERISRYDFGLLVAELFNRPKMQLKAVLQQDLQLTPPRPRDVSLNSQAAIDLGYRPTPLHIALGKLASQYRERH